jgi:hypothetical protein
MIKILTTSSSGPNWLDRTAGGFVAGALLINAAVFELGGAQLAHYMNRELLPPPHGSIVFLQHPINVPGQIAVLSTDHVVLVDRTVNG